MKNGHKFEGDGTVMELDMLMEFDDKFAFSKPDDEDENFFWEQKFVSQYCPHLQHRAISRCLQLFKHCSTNYKLELPAKLP